MIAKTHMGRGFRGALNYVIEKEGGLIIGGNMAGKTPRALATEFKTYRELRPNLKKALAHTSLSAEIGAKLTDEQWQEIAQDFLKEMGFIDAEAANDAGFVIVRHSDTEHDHVHILASRIKIDGSVVSDSNNYQRQEKAMRKIEQKYGLKQVENSWESGRKAMTQAEVRRYKEKGEVSDRAKLQVMLDGILANEPKSFTEFADACEIAGIRIIPQLQNKGARLNGVVYAIGEINFKASSLGKKYAPNGLKKAGVAYEFERDYERANKLADQGQDAAAAGRSGSLGGSESDQPAVGERAGQRDQGNQRGIQDATGVSRVDREPTRGNQLAAPSPGGGWRPDIRYDFNVRLDALAVAASGPRHKSKALLMKEKAWAKQHSILQADRYRLTLKPRREGDPEIVLGNDFGRKKGPDEIFYNATEVAEKIGFLSKKNAQDYDIYITPIDDNKLYFLVDDMTPSKEKSLLEAGYRPALIQESSENNKQAVMICAKTAGDEDEHKAANALIREINQKYGDPKLGAVKRPFRMAGFSNKKPGKNSPFTKIVVALNRWCDKTFEMLKAKKDEIIREREAKAQARLEAAEKRRIERETKAARALDDARATMPLDDYGKAFDQIRNQVIRNAKAKGFVIDESVVDFQAGLQMLQRGYSENDVYIAILQHPETIRKANPQDYAERTADAALIKYEQGKQGAAPTPIKRYQNNDLGF